MSSAESGQRTTHVGLITQQRRLRHLRSLSARNIIVERSHTDKDALMETYFTLHLDPTSEGFYTSEKIQDSLNPTWRSFDLQKSGINVDSSRSCFIVRVWGGRQGDYKQIIEWKVSLKGLCYLGERIHKDGLRYQPNTIIFGMFEGFYSSSDNIVDTGKKVGKDFLDSIEVEQHSAILCYSIYSLGRLHTTQRAICQTKASETKVRCAIMEKLKLAEERTKLLSLKETLLLKVGLLTEELKQRQQMLVAETAFCTKERGKVQSAEEAMREKKTQLKKDWDQLKEDKQLLHDQREECRKLHNQFGSRKTTLISELSDIYPILELGTHHEHAILGIKLPNAENYSGSDDTATATALGHTCHLILMIARFLQLPLRYPMIHCGSRSIVRDHITEQLADRDRDFPLYSRGKERFQFNYAVYLLNRNIAQLRFALGLPTSDLRTTLPNLKSLLETKWGVKVSNPSVLQVEPAVVSQPQPHSSQISEVAIPRTVSPSYPAQYSDTPASEAAEVAAVDPEDDDIPPSLPPPYQVTEDQSASVGSASVGGGNASIAESVSSIASSGNIITKALQHTVQYEDDHSSAAVEPSADALNTLSSSPSLDRRHVGEAHVKQGSSIISEELRSEQTDIDPHNNRTSSPQHCEMPTTVGAENAIVTEHNSTINNAPSPNRTNVNDKSPNTVTTVPIALRCKQVHANIPSDSNRPHQLADPLRQNSKNDVSGTRDQSNENHHNHNSHIEKSAASKDSIPTATSQVPSSSNSANSSAATYNHQENQRYQGGDTNYSGSDDPLEVQRIMDTLGTLEGMFQFDDLGSRTDALDEDGTSFSSFRKPSTSGGS